MRKFFNKLIHHVHDTAIVCFKLSDLFHLHVIDNSGNQPVGKFTLFHKVDLFHDEILNLFQRLSLFSLA